MEILYNYMHMFCGNVEFVSNQIAKVSENKVKANNNEFTIYVLFHF